MKETGTKFILKEKIILSVIRVKNMFHYVSYTWEYNIYICFQFNLSIIVHIVGVQLCLVIGRPTSRHPPSPLHLPE